MWSVWRERQQLVLGCGFWAVRLRGEPWLRASCSDAVQGLQQARAHLDSEAATEVFLSGALAPLLSFTPPAGLRRGTEFLQWLQLQAGQALTGPGDPPETEPPWLWLETGASLFRRHAAPVLACALQASRRGWFDGREQSQAGLRRVLALRPLWTTALDRNLCKGLKAVSVFDGETLTQLQLGRWGAVVQGQSRLQPISSADAQARHRRWSLEFATGTCGLVQWSEPAGSTPAGATGGWMRIDELEPS